MTLPLPTQQTMAWADQANVRFPDLPRLKPTDRPDCCGSSGTTTAKVMVRMRSDGRPLLFCAHHYHKHEPAIRDEADVVEDIRETSEVKE